MCIKVACVIEEGRYGGPQARIAAVAARLREEEIESVVIVPKGNSEAFIRKLEREGVPWISLDMHRLTRHVTHLVGYLMCFPVEIAHLARTIRALGCQVVHCNGSWQVKGMIAGKAVGAKVLCHLNDTNRPVLVKVLFAVLASFLADRVVFAGEKVRQYYSSQSVLKRKPTSEIQAPVDTKIFCPKTRVDKKKPKECNLIVLTVGNISPAKGMEHFIYMASSLNKGFKNLKFHVVGNRLDSQREYFKKLLALQKAFGVSNLSFYEGVLDVRPFLAEAHVYVCSSVHEASPMSVWEAMSMGKSIVSFDVGDVGRFVKDGESGFVVPSGDFRTLATKVGLLLRNPDLRERFGTKARQIASEELDIHICTRKHAEVYRSMTGHSAGGRRSIS